MSIGLRSARTLVRACVLLCGFGLCSPTLFAYPVTWEFSGTVTSSAGSASELSEDLPLGTPVRVVVGFDTDEPYTTRPSSDGRDGIRYQYFGAPSLTLAIFGGNDEDRLLDIGTVQQLFGRMQPDGAAGERREGFFVRLVVKTSALPGGRQNRGESGHGIEDSECRMEDTGGRPSRI